MVGRRPEILMPKAVGIWKALYDLDLVEDDVFAKWAEKVSKKYIKKEYLERVVGLSPSEASKVIVKMVPASWTNRAD